MIYHIKIKFLSHKYIFTLKPEIRKCRNFLIFKILNNQWNEWVRLIKNTLQKYL
jgi:hypothetical protein